MFGKYSTTTKKNTYDKAIFLKLRISTKFRASVFRKICKTLFLSEQVLPY